MKLKRSGKRSEIGNNKESPGPVESFLTFKSFFSKSAVNKKGNINREEDTIRRNTASLQEAITEKEEPHSFNYNVGKLCDDTGHCSRCAKLIVFLLRIASL